MLSLPEKYKYRFEIHLSELDKNKQKTTPGE